MTIILIRTIIMYLLVVFSLRVMGKRQLGQLEPSEFVAAIIMSELAAMPLTDTGIPLINAIVATLAILVLELILSEFVLKSIKARQLLCGKPSTLIRDGKILQSELRRSRISVDELIEELRIKGVLDLSTIQYAVLESNGTLSVVLLPENQPVTAAQMQVEVNTSSMPLIIISDGRWLTNNLKLCGVSPQFLEAELRANNITHVSQVFLLMIDNQHRFYLYPKENTNP